MKTDFEKKDDKIEVPRETGIEGFLLAIREVLKQPRVQTVMLDATGTIYVTRFVRVGAPDMPIAINFDSVTPFAAVRSGYVIEVPSSSAEPPLEVIFRLFNICAQDQMYPVAVIIGANSTFHTWLEYAHPQAAVRDTIYGLRILRDRHIPDDVLILASSYGPNGDLVDVRNCYKTTLPLETTVAGTALVPLTTTGQETIL